MPIVYVHGVSVRQDPPYPPQTEVYLRQLIAPVIAPDDPGGVEIVRANWFADGVKLAWSGRSIPVARAAVLGDDLAGRATAERSAPERAIAVTELNPALSDLRGGRGGRVLGAGGPPAAPRLADFSADELSNFLAAILESGNAPGRPDEARQRALLALAADDVARDPAARRELSECASREEELDVLLRRIDRRYTERYAGAAGRPGTLGPFDFLADLRQGVGEALERAGSLPGYAATRALGPALEGLNAHLAIFTGDILTYLHGRGAPESPGPIPLHLLNGLVRARELQAARGGEPILAVTHSMGGQLMYDAVSAFLPHSQDPRLEGVRVDFWCAAASQVAFFQEVKAFLGCRPDDPYGEPPRLMVPFPDRRYLGAWWNVWDRNDYASFTAAGIFEQVDDFAYDSGLSGLRAHGGYLIQPAFFHHFAARLQAARERGWDRS